MINISISLLLKTLSLINCESQTEVMFVVKINVIKSNSNNKTKK